jgi:hypothetical protein
VRIWVAHRPPRCGDATIVGGRAASIRPRLISRSADLFFRFVFSSLPGESTFAAPPESVWKLEKEEELRLEIEGRGAENKVVIKVSAIHNTTRSRASDGAARRMKRMRARGLHVIAHVRE